MGSSSVAMDAAMNLMFKEGLVCVCVCVGGG